MSIWPRATRALTFGSIPIRTLLTACEAETFHIFLLDMVMPMISGLELGRGIRRMNTDAQIIYITTEPGFALDAYSVNPLTTCSSRWTEGVLCRYGSGGGKSRVWEKPL